MRRRFASLCGQKRARFVRHYAAHIQNGFDSVSDPQIGKSA
jgi:hypothetical protein